jgi:glycosyltransferase involved in cell wall biosynthesis
MTASKSIQRAARLDVEAPAPRYTFTVFTSTRNRAHTLRRPFESLKAQTFRDFEWLIIDNGSTDGTEELVGRLREEADFSIRYLWQEDAGKHGSINRGIELAQGKFFLILDSDDGCVPVALERFKHHWDAIPADVRDGFTGVTALCVDQFGELVGTGFPFDPTDSDSREIRYRYDVRGEKWGFHRTDVLRDHPFPSTPGYVGLIPPSSVWAAIGRSYHTRYINEQLHIYWLDQPGSLSRPTNRVEDAFGGMLESEAILSHDMEYFPDAPAEFVVKAIKYIRGSFWSGRGVAEQGRAVTSMSGRLLWLALLPTGWLVYNLERLGLARRIHQIRLLLDARS